MLELQQIYLADKDASILLYLDDEAGIRMARIADHFDLANHGRGYDAWKLATPIIRWGGCDVWYSDELVTYAP